MSEVHDVRLVNDGGSSYERFSMAMVAGGFVAFAVAAATLFGWVSVEDAIGGVSVAHVFGGGLFVYGVVTVALGALSRWGGVGTTPDRSPGLGVGVVQSVLWALIAGMVATYTMGLGSLGWLAGIPVGAAVGYLTIASREDVGATLPAAAYMLFAGGIILGGSISPTWTWEPAAFGATIPGTLVIPVLMMLGSLLGGWAAASAHEGFGTRGRQNGAFLLISLVVLLVLSVLTYLLVFVFERGIAVVVENLAIGAGTVLMCCVAALALLVTFGDVRPTIADGADTSMAFIHLGLAVLLALIGGILTYTIATNEAIAGYTMTIEPLAAIGAVPGLLVGGGLLLLLRRSTSRWDVENTIGRLIQRGLRLAVGLMIVTTLIEVVTGTQLVVSGIAVVPTLTLPIGLGAVGMLLVTSVGSRGVAVPEWVPPRTRLGTVALWAFVLSCLHATVTGYGVPGGSVGIVASGTIDWPFVMNPSQGLGIQMGVMPAMLGTVWIVLGAILFAVPLAVGAAVFLTEYASDSMFTRAVDVATNGLWSTPSIVFGLFGLAFLVPRFGGNPSIFAAQLVLGFMLLPLVLITSREAMKSVPDEYRDASAALGVSKWDTIRSVVVPAAMPGVITGVILGVGRIAGETAPLLLVLNGPNFPNSAPGVLSSFTFELGLQPPFVHVSNPALLERASALPYQLYAIITAGVGAEETFGWGTALVLLGVVLTFFAMGVISRRYFRRKLHQ